MPCYRHDRVCDTGQEESCGCTSAVRADLQPPLHSASLLSISLASLHSKGSKPWEIIYWLAEFIITDLSDLGQDNEGSDFRVWRPFPKRKSGEMDGKQSVWLEKEGLWVELHSLFWNKFQVWIHVIAHGWIKKKENAWTYRQQYKEPRTKGQLKSIVKTKHLKPEKNRLHTIENNVRWERKQKTLRKTSHNAVNITKKLKCICQRETRDLTIR